MERFLLRSQSNERKWYLLTKKQYSYYKELTDNTSIIDDNKLAKTLIDSDFLVESEMNEFDILKVNYSKTVFNSSSYKLAIFITHM